MMHPYSVNSSERSITQLILAGASIVITWVLKSNLDFPWWFEDPSIIGVFGILYFIFNRYLWKLGFLHSIGLIQTPIIDGRWVGHLRSSFDDFENEYEATLMIKQYWTMIDVSFCSSSSRGKSLTASVNVEKGDVELSYTYVNEPVASAPSGMYIHKGTSTLCFNDGLLQVTGDYYSGRGRTQYGEINLKRILE